MDLVAYYKKVVPALLKRVHRGYRLSLHDAEDIVQQAFIQLYNKHQPELLTEAEVNLLVNKFIKGLSLNQIRKNISEAGKLEELEYIQSLIVALPISSEVLEAILKLITPYSRKAFRLRYAEGLSTQEVADQLKISVSSARKMIEKGKAQLELKLEKVKEIIRND